MKGFRFFAVLALLLGALCLTGCIRQGRATVVIGSASDVPHAVAVTTHPTAEPEPSAALLDVTSYTPPQFLSEELFEKENSPIVNPKKASYARYGLDPEAMSAFEAEAAEGKQLPILHVSTEGGEYILSRTEYSSCVIDVFNCPEEQELREGSAGIRVRGNSSGYYGDVEKIKANPVPYRIKFDKKTNLLGLNGGAKCKNWVLLKAGYDLIRNDLAFRFGRAILGEHAFCSDSALVHVYVNQVYQGVYTLCEQCQANEYRVDVTEPDEDYTGVDIGYYMVIDNNPEPPCSFQVDYGKHRVTDLEGVRREFVATAYTVKSDVNTAGQVDFICQYINNVFEIVYQACESGCFYTLDENCELAPASFSSAEEAVSDVLDVESVADMYLLYEIMHDYDVGEGSFYMCVDFSEGSRCPRLQFTSPWDFNWTCEGRTDRYWAGSFSEAEFIGRNGDRSNPWFIVLIKQDWFRSLVTARWTALSEQSAVRACINEEIVLLGACAEELTQSAVNSAYNVIVWLNKRLNWMDAQFLEGHQSTTQSRTAHSTL